MSNRKVAPLMSNGNKEGKAGQPGLQRKLVILNKSESEPLVLRFLGEDDKLEEEQIVKPGMKLVVDGELALAMATATPRKTAMKKFSEKCEHEKQATRPRAAGRQGSMMQLSRPGEHSGESPLAECGRNSIEKGAKRGVGGEGRNMLVRKEINKDESETLFELVEPSVGSIVQQAHQNPGEDLVDEICTTEVDSVLSEGSTQAQHQGEDLCEAMPLTEGDGGERVVDKIKMEDDAKKVEGRTLKRGHDGQQEWVEAVGRGSVKLSKSQDGDAGRMQVGLGGARGDSCALPRPKRGSGVWGRHGSWEWKLQKGIDAGEAVGADGEGGRCVSGKRWRAQRCSTPMCFKTIKPNDLGEVTRLCEGCINDQVMGFNQFQKEGDGVGKVMKSQDRKEKNPAVSSGLGGVGEVKPAVVMAPPSIGVKRINRVRGRRESANIAMRTFSFSSVGR